MPIVRSYMCQTCGHYMSVTLTLEQADEAAPDCPACNGRSPPMQQDFKPPGIVGATAYSKAQKITDDILANDFHVADRNTSPSRPNLRYKDQSASSSPASWQASREMLEGAAAQGKQIRERFGSGLDVLQSNIKSGAEPDLIALSKQKAIRVW